jgi:hypothetical protein
MKRADVTDMVTLPIPTAEGIKLAPEIAGYIAPSLETWTQYTTENEYLSELVYKTFWGTTQEKGSNETATGRFIDTQPVINKLNSYADVFEFIEWKLSEWVATYSLPNKKEGDICLLTYGRRFIIESPDVLLKNYNESKREGVSPMILYRMLNEYLTAKYKDDPEWLNIELTKLIVEPYIHLSFKETKETFGQQAVDKKNYFPEWWNENKKLVNNFLDGKSYTSAELIAKFNEDFKLKENDSSSEPSTLL